MFFIPILCTKAREMDGCPQLPLVARLSSLPTAASWSSAWFSQKVFFFPQKLSESFSEQDVGMGLLVFLAEAACW